VGRAELAEYLLQRPTDGEAQKLAALCDRGSPDDPATLLAVAESLQRQRAAGPAAPLLEQVQRVVKEKRKLLGPYRNQINAVPAWQRLKLGDKLTLSAAGELGLDFSMVKEVASLAPLKGIPLERLLLTYCTQIDDLTPLAGMPLKVLSLNGCSEIRQLTALKGMPLTVLDLSLLNKVDSLEPLRGMPLSYLVLSGCARVHDLSPLRDTKLISLNLAHCKMVRDLGPLNNLRLEKLSLWAADQVADLTPLKEMKLIDLDAGAPRIKDLRPLKGMPLVRLVAGNASDLTPLADMPLEEIHIAPKVLSPESVKLLRRMKSLKVIYVSYHDAFPRDEFWKRYDAGEFK
jgi:hypothetical protein